MEPQILQGLVTDLEQELLRPGYTKGSFCTIDLQISLGDKTRFVFIPLTKDGDLMLPISYYAWKRQSKLHVMLLMRMRRKTWRFRVGISDADPERFSL